MPRLYLKDVLSEVGVRYTTFGACQQEEGASDRRASTSLDLLLILIGRRRRVSPCNVAGANV